MKIEIFDGKPVERGPVLRLRLVQCDLNVLVVAVDEAGDRLSASSLVRFRENGTLGRSTCVNPRLGLQLDADGRIKDTSS